MKFWNLTTIWIVQSVQIRGSVSNLENVITLCVKYASPDLINVRCVPKLKEAVTT